MTIEAVTLERLWKRDGASLCRIVVLSMVLACVGCSDHNETVVRDACINAAASASASTSATATRCSCVAAAAKRYLSKDDFDMLAKVSTFYMSNDDTETKTHFMINALVDSGVTPARASMTAMDIMFFAQKADRECRL